MAKHTPGEWRYDQKVAQVLSEDSHVLADVRFNRLSFVNIKDADATQAANGRLIAAAPRMLDLLQDLMVTWDEDRLDELRLRTRALLKEVEGG
jgi:hypothetical protein